MFENLKKKEENLLPQKTKEQHLQILNQYIGTAEREVLKVFSGRTISMNQQLEIINKELS